MRVFLRKSLRHHFFRQMGFAALVCMICTAQTPSAFAQTVWQGAVSRSDREYSQLAEKKSKGELFLTSGLVCDDASQINAVVTLSNSGEPLDGAIEQINAGAEVPRCVVGRVLFARYVEKAQSFTVGGRGFNVHRVLIVAVAMRKNSNVVPVKLDRPLEQYIVTADESQPI